MNKRCSHKRSNLRHAWPITTLRRGFAGGCCAPAICPEDDLPFTQEFLAEMLGVRRTSVTAVAHTLQVANIIKYKRGKIQILDLEGLRESACECYETVKDQYRQLLGPKSEHSERSPHAIISAVLPSPASAVRRTTAGSRFGIAAVSGFKFFRGNVRNAHGLLLLIGGDASTPSNFRPRKGGTRLLFALPWSAAE